MDTLMSLVHYYFTRFAYRGLKQPRYYIIFIMILVTIVLVLSRVTLQAYPY